MMHILSTLLLPLSLYLLGQTVATPFPGWGDCRGHECVTDEQAAYFVQSVQSLYHCMDPALAQEVLTSDFVSYSYTLLRTPGELVQDGNNVYAASREEFVQLQLAAKPETCDDPPFKTYRIWNGCNVIGFWWSLTPNDAQAEAPYEFVGIDILEIDVASGKIKADYSEYSY